MVDGPDRVAPNAHATYSITVQNTGATAWPPTTRVVVADGTASEIYDPASWTSPTEVGPINTTIPAGATGVIDIDIETPSVTEETPVFAQLALSDGSAQFGTCDHEESAEAGDQHDDESAHTTGVCNAGGASSGFAALLGPMLLGVIRRRRR
ncbi:MAG: NBR1-Ig-like domain-containing protein [Kofleriaceae bacterium]|nr:NBR1-Ig-like domain-containing protein [Kofleriaceae bacterium]